MEHLTYMTSLAEQLRELKEEITPQKFATVVLGSLPESYDNFISSLNTTKVDELNRPFPNYLWPLFQSESWCSSFHMKISFHLRVNEN